jgi:hypothetical protein
MMITLITAKEANELYGQQPGCKPYKKAQSLIELMQRRRFTIHSVHGQHAVNRDDVITVAQMRIEENVWKRQRDASKAKEATPPEDKRLAILRRLAGNAGVLAR